MKKEETRIPGPGKCKFNPAGHRWHIQDQELTVIKPFPTAKFNKYPLSLECSRCHMVVVVKCKTSSERLEMLSKLPHLPKFPK